MAPAGTLFFPVSVLNGFLNGSADEVRFLNFHAPGARFLD